MNDLSCLFFTNYKIYVVTSETNRKKAQGGKRVLYTTHNPTYDAKNRFGLPEEMDLSFEGIKHLFEQPVKKPSKPASPAEAKERATITKLRSMLKEANIAEDDLKKVVAGRGHYPQETKLEDYSDDFITRWIIPNWKKITETVSTGGNE